ncbi:FtsW/RodA/SpoVE family cell cycle protein [Bacillus fonticola]|uniref:FtsW/RodA/SpoVE family cell cycle protein n=1 Tax=Bacillus fonticola TaxID=2728853 RepID=UPI001475FD8D|nr:FtsW/RodA/SpoVE family cell cycle protein [Bacillus fonticola]
MNATKKVGERFDWTLCLLLFLFFLVSIVSITSAQTSGQYMDNFALRQVVWYGIGAFIIAVAIYLEPDQYWKLSWIAFGFGILLLAFLLVAPESIAERRNGAKSWYTLPGIGSIQPAEFMKTFLILALSRLIAQHHLVNPVKTLKTDGWLFLKITVLSSIPLGLVMLQPDLGTALVFIAIILGMLLVSGISWKILIPVFTFGAAFATTIILLIIYRGEWISNFLEIDSYQLGRIYSWLDPYSSAQNDAYNLIQALTAIGSGEVTGKGFNGGEVYIPEQHTDFIFTVIGEEYGFIGASIVISLFFLLIYHLIKVALDTKTPFNAYIITGVISMMTFHVFQNIGMSIQVLPITGIPLPFISYGGSSLMGNMLAMGLVFSIRFHHKTYMFSSDRDD